MLSACDVWMQNGSAQELAALAGAHPSKTRPAPPSKADLAEMGEDGSGLSLQEMLHNIARPRPGPATHPLGNGKPWGTEAGATHRLEAPRALHGTRIGPAARILA